MGAPRRKDPLWWHVLVWTAVGLQGVVFALQLAGKLDAQAGTVWHVLFWVAALGGLLSMVLAWVFRPSHRSGDDAQWDELRERELERRHRRLASDPLPERRVEE